MTLEANASKGQREWMGVARGDLEGNTKDPLRPNRNTVHRTGGRISHCRVSQYLVQLFPGCADWQRAFPDDRPTHAELHLYGSTSTAGHVMTVIN